MDESRLEPAAGSAPATIGRVSRRAALRQVGRGGLTASALAALGLAHAPATLAQDTACDCGGSPDHAATGCGCEPPEPIVPPATLETLPETTPETAGRLRRLTDYDRGLWLDVGERWVDLRGHVFDVRAFGATGDGETDDWPAFNAALAAMISWLEADSTAPDAHTLLVPPGTYRLAQSLVVDRAVRVMGTGAGGRFADAVLRFDAGLAGIVVQAAQPGLTGTPGRRADGAVLERLRIEAAAPGQPQTRVSEGLPSVPSGPAHGIWLRTRAAVLHCVVAGFADDGIRVEVGDDVPGTAATGWHVEACDVFGCGGHGLGLSRASGGVCALLSATDNGGWGIADDGELGNAYLQCRADGNGLGAFTSTGETNRGLFLGCASAEGQPRSAFAAATLVVGGDHAAGFAGGNAWSATGARMLLQAQQPGGQPALPTAPTLHLRGATDQTEPHLRVSDPTDGRLAELDPAGRLSLGPQDVAATGITETGEAAPGAAPLLLNLIHAVSGRAGIRWVVPTADGGVVAQLQAFRDAANPDVPGAAAGARLTFQTAGTGGVLDTMTLREGRVGIGTVAPAPAAVLDLSSSTQGFLPPRLTSEERDAIPAPPEGLSIYNSTTKRTNVFDGTAWQETGLLPPRLTEEQRNAIDAPPEGLTIYNLTTKRLNVHDGDAWRELAFTAPADEAAGG